MSENNIAIMEAPVVKVVNRTEEDTKRMLTVKTMLHDIKNPIARFFLMNDLLEDKMSDEQRLEHHKTGSTLILKQMDKLSHDVAKTGEKEEDKWFMELYGKDNSFDEMTGRFLEYYTELRESLEGKKVITRMLSTEEYEKKMKEENKNGIELICWNLSKYSEAYMDAIYFGGDKTGIVRIGEEMDISIDRSVTSFRKLLNEVRSFSTVDEYEIEVSEVDITNLCKGVVTDNYERSNYSIPNIDVVTSKDNFKIATDEKIIKKTLNNLIDNGIKYGVDSEGRMQDMRIEIASDTENRTTITVKDSGIGMSEGVVERFNKVILPGRLMSWEHKKIEGSGIGLYGCRKFLEKIGATLKVQSELGKGSAFTITVPDLKTTQ